MKPLTIIKAIGAGVTALYHAVESVKYTQNGDVTGAQRCADEWLYAVDSMKDSLEGLQDKPKPHQPYHFNGAGRAMPVFHGSDES